MDAGGETRSGAETRRVDPPSSSEERRDAPGVVGAQRRYELLPQQRRLLAAPLPDVDARAEEVVGDGFGDARVARVACGGRSEVCV